MRRLLATLVRPLFRLSLRWIPTPDPWERLAVAPSLHHFGSGARKDFAHYLSGPSGVSASSIEEMQDWLLGCEYESDDTLFGEPDFWQHPITFERLRAGDCEDFALWAWRKLVELNVDAELVAGYSVVAGALAGRHAWLVFRQGNVEFLFEPGARKRSRMIRPLADAKHAYIPQFGVDRHGRRFAYAGYLVAEKMKLPGHKAPGSA